MYENRPFLLSKQNCRTQVVRNKLSGLKIPFFPQYLQITIFYMEKNLLSPMRPCILLEQFAWMDSIGRRLISQTYPISVKKRMDELTLRVNLLRKKPGKSRMKMSNYLPHEMGTHSVYGVLCTCSSTFCVKATKTSNHCAGDHVASDLLVCLLNVPLREHEKERSLLKHKWNVFFSFQN